MSHFHVHGKGHWGQSVYNGVRDDSLPVIRPIQSGGPSVDSKKSIIELQRVAESSVKSTIVCPLLKNARQRLHEILQIYLLPDVIWLCAEYHVDPEHESQIYATINLSKVEWDYANTLYNLIKHNIIPKEETYTIMAACQKTQLIAWSIKYETNQFTFITSEYSICMGTTGYPDGTNGETGWLSVKSCVFKDDNVKGYIIPGTTWNIPGNKQWFVEDFRQAQVYQSLPTESRVFVSICWKLFGYVTPITHYVFPHNTDMFYV